MHLLLNYWYDMHPPFRFFFFLFFRIKSWNNIFHVQLKLKCNTTWLLTEDIYCMLCLFHVYTFCCQTLVWHAPPFSFLFCLSISLFFFYKPLIKKLFMLLWNWYTMTVEWRSLHCHYNQIHYSVIKWKKHGNHVHKNRSL